MQRTFLQTMTAGLLLQHDPILASNNGATFQWPRNPCSKRVRCWQQSGVREVVGLAATSTYFCSSSGRCCKQLWPAFVANCMWRWTLATRTTNIGSRQWTACMNCQSSIAQFDGIRNIVWLYIGHGMKISKIVFPCLNIMKITFKYSIFFKSNIIFMPFKKMKKIWSSQLSIPQTCKKSC
jgi:hypothetical protein